MNNGKGGSGLFFFEYSVLGSPTVFLAVLLPLLLLFLAVADDPTIGNFDVFSFDEANGWSDRKDFTALVLTGELREESAIDEPLRTGGGRGFCPQSRFLPKLSTGRGSELGLLCPSKDSDESWP